MATSALALERAFPTLATRLPRVALTTLPTRVHRLPRLAAELGMTDLWIKRDDESCPIYGGNKPRKLELILGDAIAKGKKTVITSGGIGTHHGLATALLARTLDLRTILLLLKQPVTASVRQSLLLDFLAGAELVYGPSVLRLTGRGLRIAGRELWRHELPYIIPTGGTSALGTVGYINAALELRDQIAAGELPEPASIFVPLGSGGTIAGLMAGLKLAGLRSRVVGVLVTDILAPGARRLALLANQSLRLLHRLATDMPRVWVGSGDVTILPGYIGTGYGAPTEPGQSALRRLLELEGIHLDNTYTAKCLAALIDAVKHPRYRDAPVLFWNTYNSLDIAARLAPLPDYHELPTAFHRFFTGPLEG